jgi:hypothetical protein
MELCFKKEINAKPDQKRWGSGQYLVVVIKKIESGSYFSTMYSTGDATRPKHKKLKEIKP